jgi:hypothetical protein
MPAPKPVHIPLASPEAVHVAALQFWMLRQRLTRHQAGRARKQIREAAERFGVRLSGDWYQGPKPHQIEKRTVYVI